MDLFCRLKPRNYIRSGPYVCDMHAHAVTFVKLEATQLVDERSTVSFLHQSPTFCCLCALSLLVSRICATDYVSVAIMPLALLAPHNLEAHDQSVNHLISGRESHRVFLDVIPHLAMLAPLLDRAENLHSTSLLRQHPLRSDRCDSGTCDRRKSVNFRWRRS